MRAYSVHSRALGPKEGAMLVFAHTAREARTIGWRECCNTLTDDYLDFAASWLRDCDWLFKEADAEKLAADTPHLVWNIRACRACEMWGDSEIGDDGLCDSCRNDICHVCGHVFEICICQ